MTGRAAPTRELLTYFDAAHRNLLGVPAEIRGGKDAKLIADLWKRQGDYMTRHLIDDFFASSDPWIKNHGYTVGMFVSQAGKLIARRIQRERSQPATSRDDWFSECQRLHGGKCNGYRAHDLQLFIDAEKAKGA